MINILLLEDNENIAQSFIRNYSSELVRVKVVSRVDQVFHELDSPIEYDTVIIDPVMSNTMDFPVLLEELCKKNIDIKIVYPDKFVPYFLEQANKRNLESVSLQDTSQLFNIIESLIKRKSGNTSSIREDTRQLEIKIIKTEVHLDNLTSEVSRQGVKIDSLEEQTRKQSSDLIEMKNNQVVMIDSTKKLDAKIDSITSELERTIDPDLQLKIKSQEEGTKRFMAVLGVLTALVTTIGVIAVPFSSVIIEWVKLHYPSKNK